MALPSNWPTFGPMEVIYPPVLSVFIKPGIVFIKDGWGATDHIDLWNGFMMKAGDSSYFSLGKEVWVWEIP